LQAQSPSEIKALNKLDEIAFTALETNSSDITEKANDLLEAGKKADSPIHQINAYTILGIISKNKGYYVTSVDYYNQALNVAEQTKDDGRISACYNNIGSVYQIQENYSKALVYYKKSLDLEDKLNSPLQKSIRLYNIGEIYREMDSLSLALSNFNSSLIIEKEHNNNEGIVYALLGIADVYLQLDRPTDASISLEEVKDLINETDIEILILYNTLRGELLFKQRKFDEALATLRKAKDISEKHEFRVHLMDIYEKEIKIKTAQEKQAAANNKLSPEKDDSSNLIWYLVISFVLILSITVFRTKRIRDKKKILGSEVAAPTETNAKFKLKNDKGRVLVDIELKNILCFEANDNYVNIYHLLEDGSIKKSMQRISLKKVEEILNELDVIFKRVHKSYLINPAQIDKIGGKAQAYRVTLKQFDKEIPVSRNFNISDISA